MPAPYHRILHRYYWDPYIGYGNILDAIGPSGAVDVPFSLGEHVVELRATDPEGADASDYVTIWID